MHLAQKDGWGPQTHACVASASRGAGARLKLIERISGLVFQLAPRPNVCRPPGRNGPSALTQEKSRKVVSCNGLLNTTGFAFHIFTLHIATFQVRGFFAYKAFPLTVATVLCEPLRTLSRGLCTLPHAAAHRLLPLRELPSVSASQTLTLADKLIALSDPTL